MIAREIGSMRVANDAIRVCEWQLPVETIQKFIDTLDHAGRLLFLYMPDQDNEVQWFATLPPDPADAPARIIAFGRLQSVDDGTVNFSCVVHQDFRDVGLGKLMIRHATDLAIRYRHRTIIAEIVNPKKLWDSVAPLSVRAISILENEDFVLQKSEVPSLLVYKKELQWV